jgi:hypothetical protein
LMASPRRSGVSAVILLVFRGDITFDANWNQARESGGPSKYVRWYGPAEPDRGGIGRRAPSRTDPIARVLGRRPPFGLRASRLSRWQIFAGIHRTFVRLLIAAHRRGFGACR